MDHHQLTSKKIAGWGDWFTPSPEAQENAVNQMRTDSIANAIRSLSQIEDDPRIAQIIQQLNTLR